MELRATDRKSAGWAFAMSGMICYHLILRQLCSYFLGSFSEETLNVTEWVALATCRNKTRSLLVSRTWKNGELVKLRHGL